MNIAHPCVITNVATIKNTRNHDFTADKYLYKTENFKFPLARFSSSSTCTFSLSGSSTLLVDIFDIARKKFFSYKTYYYIKNVHILTYI